MLKPKQQLFLEALLTARTVDEATKSAGISSSTAYVYLADETFKAELAKRKDESLTHISTRLNHIGHEAVGKLQEVIQDTDATHANHIQASKVVLEFMYRAKEIEDLQERLERMEQAIAEYEKN